MLEFEGRLKQYLREMGSNAEHLSFDQSCHSVAQAADAAGCAPTDLVKNICMIDENKNLIVAIVKGEDRASTSRVGKALGINRPNIANPDQILDHTGYPCGGTPSFAYTAIFLIDPKVMEKSVVYSGGGSPESLVRITPSELLKLNRGQVVRVRK